MTYAVWELCQLKRMHLLWNGCIPTGCFPQISVDRAIQANPCLNFFNEIVQSAVTSATLMQPFHQPSARISAYSQPTFAINGLSDL